MSFQKSPNNDLYTLEANLASQALRELTDGADKDAITKLRLLCFSRGATGILGLGRYECLIGP